MILPIGLIGAMSMATTSACREAGTGHAGGRESVPYPNRPITLVSWVTPGGPTDLLARAIAKVGREHFGQRIDVLTKRGGGGAVAMQHLLGQEPDGYTLAIFTSSGVVTLASGRTPFGVDQFSYSNNKI